MDADSYMSTAGYYWPVLVGDPSDASARAASPGTAAEASSRTAATDSSHS